MIGRPTSGPPDSFDVDRIAECRFESKSTETEKTERIAELTMRTDELERQEEQLIEDAQLQGVDIYRRATLR